MFVAVKSLRKSYGSKEILKGIDLEVARGEVVAVIGPTGAGKTTLLRILDLLERPTSGAVFLDGQDVSTSEKLRLRTRRRIAIVLQRPVVFNATVYSNVAYGLRIRKEKRADSHRKVMTALETVGLSGYQDRDARTLSGGEVQRVALARAMTVAPQMLLLDEPTANLDPVSAALVEQHVRQVIERLNTTVIMATHDFYQGQRLADRIGVLIDGRMAQAGTPREIFGKPQSREVAQFVGVENILDGLVTGNQEGLVTIDIGGRATMEAIANLTIGDEAIVCIRAEEVTLTSAESPSSARNRFRGEIVRLVPMGPVARVEIDCGFPLVAVVTMRSAEEMEMQEGKRVHASFKASGVHVVGKAG